MNEIVFGFDLDNTLIDYKLAARKYSAKYLNQQSDNVRELKQYFSQLSNDEGWQRAQSWIYTEGLNYAKPTAGSINFIKTLSLKSIPYYVVSHKTVSTPSQFGSRLLRKPALNWISENFGSEFFKRRSIYFEDSRVDKILRISELGITHFIDDLIDVFRDSSFPLGVTKFLYEPHECADIKLRGVTSIRNFDEIQL